MANYIGLDKGFMVLSTYNTSAATGVTAYRFVKGTAQNQIDQQTASNLISLGVVQENVDQAKVVTGKITANVRMSGISKVVAGAAVTVNTEVMSDTQGRAITAVTATNRVTGVALQAAAAAGDIIDVYLALPGRVL